ncbi:hypothetical protein LSUE1_G007573 [Lachnellula suecica]|uniref:Gamma-glutamylcyclotransferase AIG2-like domain-containing protein n=1 Tax=Lachnellula suecica TaxID=602035 RepID=A0A8T9C7P6_9HELO|nr:hypothetical protein LSUE1_G007573 [Lachnellula suecica]
MDSLEELKQMARNATDAQADGERPSEASIARWQNLFQYSRSEAADLILEHRNNFSRHRVSDEHWQLVQEEKEAQGYDREAYEHELEMSGRPKKSTGHQGKKVLLSEAQARVMYLLKLEGPLNTSDRIREAGSLRASPEIIQGSGDDGEAAFCQIDRKAKYAISFWLRAQNLTFKPTLVRLPGNAAKDFSTYSRYPTLGLDSTLLQYRPAKNQSFRPGQEEYPVWYFFYGTLADPMVLSRHLSIADDQSLVLKPAKISGEKLRTWAANIGLWLMVLPLLRWKDRHFWWNQKSMRMH